MIIEVCKFFKKIYFIVFAYLWPQIGFITAKTAKTPKSKCLIKFQKDLKINSCIYQNRFQGLPHDYDSQ